MKNNINNPIMINVNECMRIRLISFLSISDSVYSYTST